MYAITFYGSENRNKKSAFWQDIFVVLDSLDHSEYVKVLGYLKQNQK